MRARRRFYVISAQIRLYLQDFRQNNGVFRCFIGKFHSILTFFVSFSKNSDLQIELHFVLFSKFNDFYVGSNFNERPDRIGPLRHVT